MNILVMVVVSVFNGIECLGFCKLLDRFIFVVMLVKVGNMMVKMVKKLMGKVVLLVLLLDFIVGGLGVSLVVLLFIVRLVFILLGVVVEGSC